MNATIDGRQADHQSTIVEIEGKIHNRKIYILIDPLASLSLVIPSLVNSCILKREKHPKSWLVQLETGTKIKIT